MIELRSRQNRQRTAVRPRVSPASRVYAIGDLHGRQDLLLAAMEEIIADATQCNDERKVRLIFLGDYIDRGDDSAKVLETLLSLYRTAGEDLVLLRGNHEDALLEFLASPVTGRAWLDYGAHQTLASYRIAQPSRTPSNEDLIKLRDALVTAMGPHVEFLRQMPCVAHDGDAIFVHASIDPQDAETLENTRAMLWGHPAGLTDQPVAGKIVVHGHFDDTEVVNRPGRVCVDTGAYYSGRLSVARLDEEVSFLTVESRG